jgi:hypothetical protein
LVIEFGWSTLGYDGKSVRMANACGSIFINRRLILPGLLICVRNRGAGADGRSIACGGRAPQAISLIDISQNEIDGTMSTSISLATSQAAAAGSSIIVTTTISDQFDQWGLTPLLCMDEAGKSYQLDANGGNSGLGGPAIWSTHSIASSLPAQRLR